LSKRNNDSQLHIVAQDYKQKDTKPRSNNKYRQEFCEQLITHMKEGLSFETFAAVINVSSMTMTRWSKKYKEFGRAREKGTLYRQMLLEKTIILTATGAMRGNAPLLKTMAHNILGWSNSDGKTEESLDRLTGDKLKKEIVIKTSYDPLQDDIALDESSSTIDEEEAV